MANIFQILIALLPIIEKVGPVLLAAEQALATGGIAGLIAYLETLLASPPAGIDAAKLSPIVSSLKSQHATCCARKP